MVGLGIVAALGLAACGAGQITETDTQLPAVNGAMGQAGTVSLRNIQLAYPPDGTYPRGGKATLTGSIINDGEGQDELVSVSAPVATKVNINGERQLPSRRVLIAEKGFEIATSAPHSLESSAFTTTQSPSAGAASSEAPASSSAPSSASSVAPTSGSQIGAAAPTLPTAGTTMATSLPLDRGKIVITLEGLKEPVASGKTIPITFVFRHGGSVTLEVPIAVPTKPRGEQAEGH